MRNRKATRVHKARQKDGNRIKLDRILKRKQFICGVMFASERGSFSVYLAQVNA